MKKCCYLHALAAKFCQHEANCLVERAQELRVTSKDKDNKECCFWIINTYRNVNVFGSILKVCLIFRSKFFKLKITGTSDCGWILKSTGTGIPHQTFYAVQNRFTMHYRYVRLSTLCFPFPQFFLILIQSRNYIQVPTVDIEKHHKQVRNEIWNF
jgi:hypothetical protein